MNLLCIDTSGRALVLALVRPGRALVGRVTETDGKHAEVLLPEIGALLTAAELESAAVEAIGVTLGPGGFTSVRVGLATAKGLCVARERALYATSSLRALAHVPTVPDGATAGGAGCTAVVTRAYRGEVYAALYAPGDAELRELLPPFHAPPDRALAKLSARAHEAGLAGQVVGDAWELLWAAGAGGAGWTAPQREANALTPEALAAAIMAEVRAGRARDVAALGPEYLRAPDAALPKSR